MYDGHTVGVVVPAYDEEGFVGRTIDGIPPFVDRIYVVDDASTDGTGREIEAHAARRNDAGPPEAPGFDRTVVPLRHEGNRGVGGAIKTGYRRAVEDGVQITAVMGGDDQMNPAELYRYLDPIARGEADYVKGSRFLRREDWAAMPRFRLVGNVLLSYLTKLGSGYFSILDPQNGYTAISLSALERIDLDGMYEYYGYCNDLLVKLNVENLRVADVPRSSTFAYDDGWKSHIDYAEYVPRVSGMLARNFFFRLNRKYLLREFHPLALFYYLGVAVAGAGVARLVSAILRRGDDTDRSGQDRARSGHDTDRSGDWARTILAGVVLFLYAAVLDAEDNRELERRIVDEEIPGTKEPEADPSDRGSEPDEAPNREERQREDPDQERPAPGEPVAADGGAE